MFKKKRLHIAVVAAVTAMGASQLHAAEIEEIVVTATKRAQPLQDVAVSVTALSEETLEQIGVSNFDDYMLLLPGVTAGGSGPGQNTIYIRGVASTTPNLTTAGVAGLAPNVAFYLDEQPLAQPGRNLDVYTADLARIETLSGPQGTLFGASSQAGTVRLITNKPDDSGTYGKVKFGTAWTEDGEMSNNVEAMFNAPITDTITARGVVYVDNKGGYIDNVRGTRDLRESARFREAGTIRRNGEPVSSRRAGFQSASGAALAAAQGDTFNRGARDPDLSNVVFLTADNSALVEEDFNDTTYSGGRVSVSWNINDDWNLLVGFAQQDLDTEGVFFADPDLGDYEIERFHEDDVEDQFQNYNWTLTGRLGELEVVYTGAFTDRETNQTVDYTDYMFVGQYLPYYICDSSVSYPEYNYSEDPALGYTNNLPEGTCQAPNTFVRSVTETEVQTHELRIATDPDKRWRVTAGGFYSDLELTERNDFTYPGATAISGFPGFGGGTGWNPGFPFGANGEGPGAYNSDAGPFPGDVIFRNDIRRTDEQMGVFGEFSFDFSDQLSMTVGARWYDIEVDFEGGANGQFCNAGGNGTDRNRFGTNISDLYDGDGSFTFIGDCTSGGGLTFTADQTFEEISAIIAAADPYSYGRGQLGITAPNAISNGEIQGIVNSTRAPDSAEADGTIVKATMSWRPNGDQMYYATFSEGFRPGLLNRPGGAIGANGFTVPFELQTDDMTNYEFGWKSSYLNNSLRFNGSIFFLEIEKLQTTIFDPSISNLFFSDNAADAEVMGIEGDLVWLPNVEGLTISAAFSLLDSEITEVLTPTNDVREGDELAFAPEYQGNIRARYEWGVGSGLMAHFMPHMTFSGKSYTDIVTINRMELDSWVMGGLTTGVSSDDWTAELYIDNITNEQAEMSGSFVFDVERVVYARPRTWGLRMTYHFNP